MPLYVYTCRTCELELEELHPLGQAPQRSIRCPLCGGYFERDIALFHVNGRKAATVETGPRPRHPPRRQLCLLLAPSGAPVTGSLILLFWVRRPPGSQLCQRLLRRGDCVGLYALLYVGLALAAEVKASAD